MRGCRSATRRAATFGCGAALLWCALGIAHAALFDDEEARRQIAVEKKRVDEVKADLKAQQDAVDARIGKLEEALKSQALLDLFTQLEALKLEMNKLRGQIEVLSNNVENTSKRQRDMYLDLDTRVRRFEQQGAPPPLAPGAAAPAATGSSPATPAVAAVPGAPAVAATRPGAAPAAVTTVDPGVETRVYEAAQGERRVGNYQGAIVAFQNFIKQHPQSNLAPRAQYWIGDSYFNLRDFRLAISSQQALIKTYPDSASVPDAMLNMASAQIEMGESVLGRKTLEELTAKFPISDAAEKGRRRLAALNAPASAASVQPAAAPAKR